MFLFRRLFSTFSPMSPATMAQAKQTVQKYIDDNKVVVFSKSYCPYCKATKQTLTGLGAEYLAIELDQRGMSVPSLGPLQSQPPHPAASPPLLSCSPTTLPH